MILGLRTDTNSNEIQAIEHRFGDLDDFESGTDIDVWDHKWVDEMNDYSEILIELVKDWPLGCGGKILDADGNAMLS